MASATTLWLLVAIAAAACSADVIRTQMDVMSKRFKLPNIENGWPLPDEETEQETNVEGLLIQMPACLSLGGVCALNNECQPGYAHEATDLCGDQRDAVCCQTRFPEDKHVIQLHSCAAVGGFCAWEEDCPRGERMVNELLCGEQFGVTCCKGGIIEKRGLDDSSRAHSVQLESCVSLGGICRPREQCSRKDRVVVDYDSCGAQPSMACCKASDDETSRAHSVQLKSCMALGGICRPRGQCSREDRVAVNYDSCGAQPSMACCKASDEESSRAHSVQLKSCMALGGMCRPREQCLHRDRVEVDYDSCGAGRSMACCKEYDSRGRVFPIIKKNLIIDESSRAHSVQLESCVALGGICRPKEQCSQKDRVAVDYDSCGVQPSMACCKASDDESSRAHSVQLQSCMALGGICRPRGQCFREDRVAVDYDSCGAQPTMTCCKASDEKLSKAHTVQLKSCTALGGICRPREKCPRRNRVAVDYDSCGVQPYLTCCTASDSDDDVDQPIKNNETIENKSRAHSVQLQSCMALGGLCRPKEQCPRNDRVLVDYDSCGVQPNLACCKATDVGDRFNPLMKENEIIDDKRKKSSKKLSKSHRVQLKSCMEAGGLCRPKKQCPEEDRMGSSDMCGNQPFITCCYSTNSTRPNGPLEFTDENTITKKSKMYIAKRPEEFTDKNMYVETPVLSCVMKGGLCVLAQDCATEDTYEEAGLCGEAIEVSCCKRLPRKKAPCETRGGECVSATMCGNGPRDVFGTCAGDDVCCVWTH